VDIPDRRCYIQGDVSGVEERFAEMDDADSELGHSLNQFSIVFGERVPLN